MSSKSEQVGSPTFPLQTTRTHNSTRSSPVNHSSISKRVNPVLQQKLAHMRLRLAPIYPLPQGNPHPSFPETILQYWLLTEDQIDLMASYYHQTSPTNQWHNQYPATMRWDSQFLAKPDHLRMSEGEIAELLNDGERLGVKRRMLGRFIGLKGCETPIGEVRRRIKFFEDRLERSIKLEREMTGRKFPWL
jgi:hypothetical protein